MIAAVSIRDNERGYTTYKNITGRGRKVVVTLDGIDQKGLITADAENGFIVRRKTDADGNVCINEKGDEFLEETIHGRVVIDLAKTHNG